MQKFDLSLWLQNKSRKVVTRECKDVEIIHTNSPVPHHPIVGFIGKSIYTWTINGKLIYSKEEQDKHDLFFADEEEGYTEFEKEVAESYEWAKTTEREDFVNEFAPKLLDLAKKELEENYYTKVLDDRMVFKSELHATDLQTAYDMGKQDALKDLPKWIPNKFEKRNWETCKAYLNTPRYLVHDEWQKHQMMKDFLEKAEKILKRMYFSDDDVNDFKNYMQDESEN